MNQKFSYPAEKFSTARRALMLPHQKGESESISRAFHECKLGLMNLSDEDVNDDARDWISKLGEFMDTGGISDLSGRGAWFIKAENFTDDDKIEISRIVNELAYYFDRNFFSL